MNRQFQNALKKQQMWMAPEKKAASKDLFTFLKRITKKDVADFTRQLATMVQARLPLIRCLEILVRQQTKSRFQELIRDVMENVKSGTPLSESMAVYPGQFGPLFVNMVQVGEVTGNMGEMLLQLSAYLEKMNGLRRKVLTAMTYPSVIVVIAIGAISYLTFGLMPTFADMFQGLEANMSASARILFGTTQFIKQYIIYILLGIIIIVFLLRAYFRSASGQLVFDRIKLNQPVIGSILRKVYIARFTRTLGTLLRSGVSLMEALEVTANSIGNRVIEQEIMNMKAYASRGESIELSLAESRIFPFLVTQMIAVGEETAELPSMLVRTAEYYEVEIDAAIDALTSLIEPIIIVVLGTVLGGAIVAIYMQIFDLMEVVQ